MEEVIYDVAIIGAGAGGMTVANYASRAGLKVALIERGLYGGQLHNTADIENYTGFTSVSGVELSMQMEQQTRAQDSIAHVFGDVKSINKNDNLFHIELAKKEVVSKTVVIATGVSHKKLSVVGEDEFEGSGVSYCAVCDANFFKDKRVAVVGGGNSAVEASLYLSNIADSVRLLHRRDELRADKVMQDKMFDTENIEVIWNAQTEEIKGQNGTVAGLVYQDKEDSERVFLEAEGVFVNIGAVPETKFLSRSWLVTDHEGFIITNSKMETTAKGLFAVGDVRSESIRQIVSATGDGAVASESIVNYLRNN